jgi:DNA-binding transcriptional ArsR family regulator
MPALARLQPTETNAVFSALADPTRRAILVRLATAEASVKPLAEPFEMSQTAISRHLKVLERAGLIERAVDKERLPARIRALPMATAIDWLAEFQTFWEQGFDALDDYPPEAVAYLRAAIRGMSRGWLTGTEILDTVLAELTSD